MSRRRSVMSESFKNELAKDLGFYDVVQREGWEGIRTKDAGNMVKRAIQIAEEHLAKQYTSSPQSNYSQQPSYSSGYQQTGYAAPQQQSYSQMSNAPYPYASAPQAQSSYTTNFSPTSYSANTASTPVQSYQNPPPAGMAYIAVPSKTGKWNSDRNFS